MRRTALGVSLFGLAALVEGVFWRQPCRNVLVTERLDPIVSPGQAPSSHSHTLCGGSNLMPTTNTSWQRASKCTSAGVAEDKSLYWVPQLFFQWENGTFSSVPGHLTIYYKIDSDDVPVEAFPDDLRMVAGDPMRTTVNASDPGQGSFRFLCLQTDGPGTDEQSPVSLTWPTTDSCTLGMRAQFSFPRCWDGKNTDSANHADHMAYPLNDVGGNKCPASHPKLMPRIFVEVYYQWNDFRGRWNEAANSSQPFLFSQGNREAFGFHGDFLNGWNEGVLEKAIKACNGGSGGTVEANCPGILTVPQQDCRITPHLDEPTEGTIAQLPGCKQLFDAETPVASPNASCPAPDILSPIIAYQGTAAPAGSCALSGGAQVLQTTNGYNYAGCLAYNGSRILTEQLGNVNSVEDCVTKCSALGYTACGLEYGKECWAAKSLADSQLPTTDDGGCSARCGNATQICGGSKHDTLYTKGGKPSAQQSTCTRTPAGAQTGITDTGTAIAAVSADGGRAQADDMLANTTSSTTSSASVRQLKLIATTMLILSMPWLLGAS